MHCLAGGQRLSDIECIQAPRELGSPVPGLAASRDHSARAAGELAPLGRPLSRRGAWRNLEGVYLRIAPAFPRGPGDFQDTLLDRTLRRPWSARLMAADALDSMTSADVIRASEGGHSPAWATSDSLAPFATETRAVRKAIDGAGEVADDASPALRDIRDRLRRQRGKLRTTLEGFLRGRDTAKYLQEQVVTDRQGRYVVVVKSEHRHAIPGLIHGSSASGASLYLEPLATVEINNELIALNEKRGRGLPDPHRADQRLPAARRRARRHHRRRDAGRRSGQGGSPPPAGPAPRPLDRRPARADRRPPSAADPSRRLAHPRRGRHRVARDREPVAVESSDPPTRVRSSPPQHRRKTSRSRRRRCCR